MMYRSAVHGENDWLDPPQIRSCEPPDVQYMLGKSTDKPHRRVLTLLIVAGRLDGRTQDRSS